MASSKATSAAGTKPNLDLNKVAMQYDPPNSQELADDIAKLLVRLKNDRDTQGCASNDDDQMCDPNVEKQAFFDLLFQVKKFQSPEKPKWRPVMVVPRDIENSCTVFVGDEAKKSFTDKTLSWCLIHPETGMCHATFCFNVDDVLSWMKKEQCVQDCTLNLNKDFNKDSQACEARPTQCKMYGYDTMKKWLDVQPEGLKRLVDIPVMMPDEFRAVIENFSILPKENTVQDLETGSVRTSLTLKKDSVTRVIMHHIQEYIQDRLRAADDSAQEKLGVFWTYSKKALAFAGSAVKRTFKFALWVLNNPFWVMIITTIAKMIRISICIFTSFDKLGPLIFKLIVDQVIGDITKIGKGIPLMIYNFMNSMIECVSSLASGAATGALGLVQAVQSCAGKMLASSAGSIMVVIGEFLGGYVQSVFDSLGLGFISNFGRILFTDPKTVFGVFMGDANAALIYDLKTVTTRFQLQDWNMAAMLLILKHIPAETLHTFLAAFISYAFPPLIPLVALMASFKKIHPVVIFQKCMTIGGSLTYAMQLLREIQEWVFDLIPCIFSYAMKTLKYFFGAISVAQNPESNVTCCLTQIIVDLQKEITEGGAQQFQKNVISKYDAARNYISSWFSSGGSQDQETAEKKMAEFVSETAPNDPLNETTVLKSSVSSSKTTLVVPTALLNDLAPGDEAAAPTTISLASRLRNWSWRGSMSAETWTAEALEVDSGDYYKQQQQQSSEYGQLWAAIADTREKHNVLQIPFFTLVLENGQKVNFYMFTWNQNAMFKDAFVVHISVSADEIALQYPKAVWVHRGRSFILLRYLPIQVVQHILAFSSPIVNLSNFIVAIH